MKKDVPHEHNTDSFFEELLNNAKQNADKGKILNLGLKSDEEFTDHYELEEEKGRSHSISAILQSYEDSYKDKIEFQKKYRRILFWGCSLVIVSFAGAIMVALYYTFKNLANIELAGMAALMTAILSLLVSIIKLVHTITKYCFPKNDEEYIIKIVKSIQKHDLKRVQEHNRIIEIHKNNPLSQSTKVIQKVRVVPKKKK